MHRRSDLAVTIGLASLFAWMILFARPAQSASRVASEAAEVLPLPGSLDDTLMLNSNSPEIVQRDGILVSTFPPAGMRSPHAHLDFPMSGDFEIFSHHINNSFKNGHTRTLFVGLLVHNPGESKVKMRVLNAASYLSVPDAPFIKLPPISHDTRGRVYAGPGDRVMSDFLRDDSQDGWPKVLTIPPHQSQMLYSLPVPDDGPVPHINGRSTLVRVRTDGPVYLASLAWFARRQGVEHQGDRGAPRLSDWENLLREGSLCEPRETAATPLEAKGRLVYGRVAGVNRGAVWTCEIPEQPSDKYLSLEPGQSIAYPISSVKAGTFGTHQIQSAPMVVRYPDTAFAAHGNYGVLYDINLSVMNRSLTGEKFSLFLQTPLKADHAQRGLEFYERPETRVFFRGSLKLNYRKGLLIRHGEYVHLVEDRGDPSHPFLEFSLRKGRKEHVHIQLYYPPDSTPPQVLTIKAVDSRGADNGNN